MSGSKGTSREAVRLKILGRSTRRRSDGGLHTSYAVNHLSPNTKRKDWTGQVLPRGTFPPEVTMALMSTWQGEATAPASGRPPDTGR